MLHPIIKWAQRKDRVFIEVPLRDIKGEKIELAPQGLSFSGESAGKNYSFNVELYEEVVPEVLLDLTQTSKWTKTGLHLSIVLTKKDSNKAYWVRLTKQPVKSQYIQCDWNKWIDDDEEQEEGNKGLEGYNPEAMNSNGLLIQILTTLIRTTRRKSSMI